MALAFARTLLQPVSAQTINTTVTYTSDQQDIGADTIAEQVYLYLEVDGFAAAPVGNKLMRVILGPIHTTAGDAFDDNSIQLLGPVAADQQYQFSWGLDGLPRFFTESVMNDTNQNTDANAVDSWIELNKVTA